MSFDPYLVPGTDTLRNRLGVTEAPKLQRIEEDLSTTRIFELESGAVRLRGRWDLAHLQAVHKHIFQDVYPWAGQIRTIAMTKGGDFHPLPHPDYAATIFERLAATNLLRGLSQEDFVSKVSQLQAELFALHPFREGNTRSSTTFVSLLAQQAGWKLDWHQCDPTDLQEALRASFRAPEADRRTSARRYHPLGAQRHPTSSTSPAGEPH